MLGSLKQELDTTSRQHALYSDWQASLGYTMRPFGKAKHDQKPTVCLWQVWVMTLKSDLCLKCDWYRKQVVSVERREPPSALKYCDVVGRVDTGTASWSGSLLCFRWAVAKSLWFSVLQVSKWGISPQISYQEIKYQNFVGFLVECWTRCCISWWLHPLLWESEGIAAIWRPLLAPQPEAAPWHPALLCIFHSTWPKRKAVNQSSAFLNGKCWCICQNPMF